jgi:hypothetical protein
LGLCNNKLTFLPNHQNILVGHKDYPTTYQNIYITSDEEIKEGDWCIMTNDFGDIYLIRIISLKCIGGNEIRVLLSLNGRENTSLKDSCKKIILTTDQDLIKDGVQAISDEFIELFVKNQSCESIEVERLENGKYVDWLADGSVIEGIYENYKIIIPKEEPKQINNFYEELKHYFETTPREKVLEDWNKSAEFDKIGPTVEEFLGMIQETIEEAADLWATDTKNVHPADSFIAKKSFIQGAKSQQEQDKNKYSDEDMINFHKWAYLKNRVEESDKTTKELLSEWFEQYKKK